MTSVDDTAVYFDPYDVDINADPYPTYARLLAEAPAYFNERYGFWALSRHDNVKKALANWPGVLEHSRVESRSKRCSTGGPSGASTTTTSSSHLPQLFEAGNGCRSPTPRVRRHHDEPSVIKPIAPPE